jgi:hypothetical protein
MEHQRDERFQEQVENQNLKFQQLFSGAAVIWPWQLRLPWKKGICKRSL